MALDAINGYCGTVMRKIDLAIGIGGAAGQGIATPGDILARIFVRRGLHLNTYDKLDLLITLNHDTMDRHLDLMRPGSVVLYNAYKIKPGLAESGVQLCAFSVKDLAPNARG